MRPVCHPHGHVFDMWCESTLFSCVDSADQENGSVELLGSPERKWGVPGE